MAILEVKNLKKSFGAQEVLKGINFEMDKGEVVVIIGSSGSGKTTLLRCLNFLETADDGQIIVDGETLFDGASDKNEKYNDLRKKRLHFGLVFQQFNLFPHMNVLKNVKISAELLAKDKIKQQIKELKQQKVRGKALSLQKSNLKKPSFRQSTPARKRLFQRSGFWTDARHILANFRADNSSASQSQEPLRSPPISCALTNRRPRSIPNLRAKS